jgi:hypothetical protein
VSRVPTTGSWPPARTRRNQPCVGVADGQNPPGVIAPVAPSAVSVAAGT